MPMTRRTGLIGPDRQHIRPQKLGARRATKTLHIQDMGRCRDQPMLPDCVGCSFGGRIHGLTGFDASDRDIWREAQMRESGAFDLDAGAYLEYAVAGIMLRGVISYRPGEEFDASPEGQETWREGLEGYPRRMLDAEHYSVPNGDLEALYAALEQDYAVVDGGPVTAQFMRRGPEQADTLVGKAEFGGSSNGHAQGIRGFWRASPRFGGKDVLLYQGSWGLDFAGCWLPDGTWSSGCFWADAAEAFPLRWDCHALSLRDWHA
jgi:hypothetical protein